MQIFLEYADPSWYARGKGRLDVTVLEAIDDAAARVDVELADEPEVRADLHYTIGNVYSAQNQAEKSRWHKARSLELYREVFGERHPRVARALWYYAISIPKPPGVIPPNIEALVRESVEMMRETGPDDINLPYMIQTLGHYDMIIGKSSKDPQRLDEAERLFLEARALFVRHYSEHNGSTTTISFNLTELVCSRGLLAPAGPLARSAVPPRRVATIASRVGAGPGPRRVGGARVNNSSFGADRTLRRRGHGLELQSAKRAQEKACDADV